MLALLVDLFPRVAQGAEVRAFPYASLDSRKSLTDDLDPNTSRFTWREEITVLENGEISKRFVKDFWNGSEAPDSPETDRATVFVAGDEERKDEEVEGEKHLETEYIKDLRRNS